MPKHAYVKIRCPLCCSDGTVRGPVAYYVRQGDGRLYDRGFRPRPESGDLRAVKARARTRRAMFPPAAQQVPTEAEQRAAAITRIDALRTLPTPVGAPGREQPGHLAPASPGGPWSSPADRLPWSASIAFTCERHPQLRRERRRGDVITSGLAAIAKGYTEMDFDGVPIGRRRVTAPPR